MLWSLTVIWCTGYLVLHLEPYETAWVVLTFFVTYLASAPGSFEEITQQISLMMDLLWYFRNGVRIAEVLVLTS